MQVHCIRFNTKKYKNKLKKMNHFLLIKQTKSLIKVLGKYQLFLIKNAYNNIIQFFVNTI